jgi:hypothetical protein
MANRSACEMTAGDIEWLRGALTAWDLTRTDILRIDPDAPTIFVYDATCVWTNNRNGQLVGNPAQWRGAVHDDAILLPDGDEISPVVASFAAPDETTGGAFFVMALPGIWKAAGVTSAVGLERLLTGVMMHELTHTAQFSTYGPRIETLTTRWELPDDLTDDVVQDRFEATPAYVAFYDLEMALLREAANAPDQRVASRLAGEALAAIAARRDAWLIGDDEKLRDLEDIFLSMEGIGNWAALSWLAHAEGGSVARDEALAVFGPVGKRWSQDEGVAIMLVVDRLVPDWPLRAFGPDGEMALSLLARAAGAR